MANFENSLLALVLAGGKGERLYPLTLERTKPSVPFGGKYRIIDFALSNLANSGIYSIYVLVQYKSQSLIEHIRTTWMKGGVLPKHFITVVPPQMRQRQIEWYRGTADAVYQNINLIYDFKPEIVAIFSGDHIYRMDIKEMINFHREHKAELTISAISLEAEGAAKFGILKLNRKFRVGDFQEKPLISSKKRVFASMGNYIFNTDILREVLEELIGKTTACDFGRDIIPYLVRKGARVFAYDFSKNIIPGLRKHEESSYWQDVGTIKSYWQANMDILGETPKLDLDNQSWPIYAGNLNSPPAYIVDSLVDNSLVSEGTRIYRAKIKNSILGRGIRIGENCEIEDSIIMDFTLVGKNCKIRRAIIDRFNEIKANTKIGFDKEADSKKYFLSPAGIVVIKRASRRVFRS